MNLKLVDILVNDDLINDKMSFYEEYLLFYKT